MYASEQGFHRPITGGNFQNGKLHKINVMKKLVLLLTFLLCACKSIPIGSIDDYNFVVYPHMTRMNEAYYLKFQFAPLQKNGTRTLVSFIEHKVIDKKLCFYVAAAVSSNDAGKIQEYRIDQTLSKYIETGEVFWMNADYSLVRLNIDK
jgi:hypothetical protein